MPSSTPLRYRDTETPRYSDEPVGGGKGGGARLQDMLVKQIPRYN